MAPDEVRKLALMCAEDLAAHADFTLSFLADWDALARSDGARALAVDAMRNATDALNLAGKGPKRAAIAERLHVVRVVGTQRSAASVQNGALVIEFAPQEGTGARPSSLMIARAIDAAF
jgi:hypothetical protein